MTQTLQCSSPTSFAEKLGAWGCPRDGISGAAEVSGSKRAVMKSQLRKADRISTHSTFRKANSVDYCRQIPLLGMAYRSVGYEAGA